MTIRYLDGPRFQRSLVAAADWVDAGREELNRINVFPVPDGDTGTNFTLTLRAVAEAVEGLHRPDLPVVNRTMAEACVLGAHGNSGMLLSQFLVGFREGIGDRLMAGVHEVAVAIRRGAERLTAALDDPVEGTILTVCRDTAAAAEGAATQTKDLGEFTRRLLRGARASLARTPELLASLRRAGVVDAGGKGFVRMIEGIMRFIDNEPIRSQVASTAPIPAAAARARVEIDRDYQYCTEVLTRGPSAPPTTEIREQLRPLGGSIVVLCTGELLKVHIHTNDPERIFTLARAWGTIEQTKADDMRLQHAALHEAEDAGTAIVVDSTADLSDELVDRHGIVVMPLQIVDQGTALRDRIDIRGEDIYRRMQEDGAEFTTSQPSPAAMLEAMRDARSGARDVLCLTVAGVLSGTYRSASNVAASGKVDRVTVFDSRTVSIGLGMLALRARDLADHGWSIEEIVRDLERTQARSGVLLTVDRLEYLVKSGRVGRARGWLGQILDVKPILELTEEGEVAPVDRVRGRARLVERVTQLLIERVTPRPPHLRIGIVHAGVPDIADVLRTRIEGTLHPNEWYTGSVTAAIGIHVGPGAWGVFYQGEDRPAAPPT